ncbi:MAG: hypothetical protein J0I18_15920 [Actinobacteria bacterium]|nr:hypothetical protein [Actinomycetota bacterium]
MNTGKPTQGRSSAPRANSGSTVGEAAAPRLDARQEKTLARLTSAVLALAAEQPITEVTTSPRAKRSTASP